MEGDTILTMNRAQSLSVDPVNSPHLLRAYYMPDPVQSILRGLSHLIPTTPLRDWDLEVSQRRTLLPKRLCNMPLVVGDMGRGFQASVGS